MAGLIVIRGNSRTGKSTVASVLRQRLPVPVAVLGQDLLRRQILTPGTDVDRYAPGVLDAIVRSLLAQGVTTIVEGIWFSGHYGETLAGLAREHAGPAAFVRLEATLDVTLRRHETSPEASFFGVDDMLAWWRDADPLPGIDELHLDADRPTAALADAIEARLGARP